MAESNKRIQKREKLLFYLRVYSAADRKYVGRVVDMSAQGLMLIVDDDVRDGMALDICVELPDDLSDSNEFKLSVRCKWCKPDINKDYYVAGFEIVSMEEDVKIIAKALLEQYSFSLTSEEA